MSKIKEFMGDPDDTSYFDDSGYNEFYPFESKREYLLALAHQNNMMHKEAIKMKQQRISQGKLQSWDNTKHWLDALKEELKTEQHYSRSF